MTVTTEEAEECARGQDAIKEASTLPGYRSIAERCAATIRSLAAERDALRAENARLRAALILARIAVYHACEDSGRLLYTQDLARIDAALGEKE